MVRDDQHKNARFWQWHNNGWVKITLRPGQSLSTADCRQTDEGFCSEYNRWALEDGIVTSEYSQESRDCDGRHSYSCSVECPVGLLRDTELCSDDPIDYHDDGSKYFTPSWVKIGSGQRDHAAEAMGY